MFFGMPSRIVNKDGRAIQGIIGFVGALLKIIRKTSPTHIAVLFDGECHNERKDLDSDYKANRPDWSDVSEKESPFSQLPDIYRALEYLKIPYAETNTCETDDWISSYVKKYSSEAEIIISSFDSDFFQLIADNVSILRYRGDNSIVCNRDYIKEKLGISPEQYADFKSLTGDAADNIKGADKVGLKTAAELINEYRNLENIIANAESIKKPSVRASIISCVDRLRTNYKLIKLGTVKDLPFAIDALEYTYGGITGTEVLRQIGVY